MRTLLICALSATVIGCSCLIPPQSSLDRTAARAPIVLGPAPLTSNPAPTKVRATPAAKTAKSSPARPEHPAGGVKEGAGGPVTAKTDAPASGERAKELVLEKAKTTIAAKMEDPTSVEFGDIKRATRKNTFGKPVDTICGHVKGKKTSGEDTGEIPFLYLVKEDEAYVVIGSSESAAAVAYRNICTDMDPRGKALRQQQKRN